MNKDTQKGLWIGLTILIVLTPLGLLATGTAFGEWSSQELQKTLGYVPEGMKSEKTLWQAIFSGYSMPGLGNSFLHSSIGYILSAVIGICLIYAATLILGKFIAKREEEQRNENS
ncbi:MAG: PDGLE domain-containing protein [Candidatus Methanoperedens sp.]|nr:PDGLE domain-containing protein [Candidatus Methanoperedens sp.]MCE8425297.1 PDGLE domain-containing protein [Candidatus Methanoperedens sp.]MCE8427818.1 PDGLE domain-containing protein [Candidatus Methanoperedens sp.]